MREARDKGPRLKRDQAGVAAIEFAFVFPVLLVLFFGMINLYLYASMNRKVTEAAGLVADLVTRQPGIITPDAINDYVIGARKIFGSSEGAAVNIDVYNFMNNGGTATERWHRFSGTAASCTAPNPGNSLAGLLAQSDVVIAVACTKFTPPVSNFPGLHFFANREIERSVTLRPRQSATLMCNPTSC